ncbi:3436_t:CDS:2 [Paraglomus occultum]|uniref:3436_t:CDS:1 n=1 Tax=Paraglomus occultum TaxID=144539 RepID=A0A9N9F5L2_9GLOM|nr:3436_t:CDS:2 [Paraglomus occultum]
MNIRKFLFLTWIALAFVTISTFVSEVTSEELGRTPELKKKHDYKLTFKKPYYFNATVPFWDIYGNTLSAPDFIRLAPGVPRQAGSIWSRIPNPHKEWQVVLSFKISGNYYTGGRGIAFWYTKDRGNPGPIIGNQDKWEGLGIFFETAAPSIGRTYPYVSAHLNDGTKKYVEERSPESATFGSCYRVFRNTQVPSLARITYKDKNLMLEVDAHHGGENYHKCFEAENIELPTGYYFGVSLKDQRLANDHDVIAFETYEINPAERAKRPLRPHEKDGASSTPPEIPEEIRKRIEEVQKVVNKPTEESGEGGYQNLDFIKGMQTEIMEQLVRLQWQLDSIAGKKVSAPGQFHVPPPRNEMHQLAVLNEKLDHIVASLMTTEEHSVSPVTKELIDQLRHLTSKITILDSRISAQDVQLQKLNQAINAQKQKEPPGILFYALYGLLTLFLLYCLYFAYRQYEESKSKKFI